MLDDLAGDYEDVELATDNIMADDLLDVLAEIALEPGYWKHCLSHCRTLLQSPWPFLR